MSVTRDRLTPWPKANGIWCVDTPVSNCAVGASLGVVLYMYIKQQQHRTIQDLTAKLWEAPGQHWHDEPPSQIVLLLVRHPYVAG